MRKVFLTLTSIATAACLAGTAQADGYRYGSIKDAPVAGFSWTGGYFGAHAGYGWGDADLTDNLPQIGGLALPTLSSSHDTNGGFGGIQMGANRQFGSLVIGAELSVSGSAIDGSGGNCLGVASLIGGGVTATCETEVKWMGTALGKIGWAWDRWMVYGAAGWSFAGAEHKFTLAAPGVFSASFAQNDTLNGFTYGGGIEWAFTEGMSLGVEYLTRRLESSGDGLLLGGALTTGDRDIDLHSVSGKLNFRF